MTLPHYQTIPELSIKGRMDTTKEFDAVGLPADFSEEGHRKVLDIGCNEGAYMIECLKRGAGYVKGVEINPIWYERTEEALRKTSPRGYEKSKRGTWLWGKEKKDRRHFAITLADAIELVETLGTDKKRYNYVLCLSVCHLIKEPNKLIKLIMERALYPGGMLILEINDRLQKIPIELPEGGKFYGKNKDNRSVWHFIR